MPPSRIRHVKWWSQRIFAFDRLSGRVATTVLRARAASVGSTQIQALSDKALAARVRGRLVAIYALLST